VDLFAIRIRDLPALANPGVQPADYVMLASFHSPDDSTPSFRPYGAFFSHQQAVYVAAGVFSASVGRSVGSP